MYAFCVYQDLVKNNTIKSDVVDSIERLKLNGEEA